MDLEVYVNVQLYRYEHNESSAGCACAFGLTYKVGECVLKSLYVYCALPPAELTPLSPLL